MDKGVTRSRSRGATLLRFGCEEQLASPRPPDPQTGSISITSHFLRRVSSAAREPGRDLGNDDMRGDPVGVDANRPQPVLRSLPPNTQASLSDVLFPPCTDGSLHH